MRVNSGGPEGKKNPVLFPREAVAGRADAGVVGERLWDELVARKAPEADGLEAVWTSAPFSHGVFTAAKDFDKDECTAEILKLEAASKWVAGSPDGFVTRIEAVQAGKRKGTGGSRR